MQWLWESDIKFQEYTSAEVRSDPYPTFERNNKGRGEDGADVLLCVPYPRNLWALVH